MYVYASINTCTLLLILSSYFSIMFLPNFHMTDAHFFLSTFDTLILYWLSYAQQVKYFHIFFIVDITGTASLSGLSKLVWESTNSVSSQVKTWGGENQAYQELKKELICISPDSQLILLWEFWYWDVLGTCTKLNDMLITIVICFRT